VVPFAAISVERPCLQMQEIAGKTDVYLSDFIGSFRLQSRTKPEIPGRAIKRPMIQCSNDTFS
jgi:hypothetical protein